MLLSSQPLHTSAPEYHCELKGAVQRGQYDDTVHKEHPGALTDNREQTEANPSADKTVNPLVQIRGNGKTLGFSTGMQIESKSQIRAIVLFKTEKQNILYVFCPNVQPCENRTQLDFIAEQCSKTDSQALYLLPNAASFYTWIPAVGLTRGGLREPLRNVQDGAVSCEFSSPVATTRRGAVQIHVPVGAGELPRETGFSVSGWNSLRVGRSASVWLHGCLFKRHLPGSNEGGDEPAEERPGNRYHGAPADVRCFPLVSSLAVTAHCILGK